MSRFRFTVVLTSLLLLIPGSVFAASTSSFEAGSSFIATTSAPGNAYILGGSIVVPAPVAGDLNAAGGSVVVTGPVTGDELLFGGSISARGRTEGDIRALGGNIMVDGSSGGDLILIGLSVQADTRPRGSVFVAALNTTLSQGANGPVIIYGNNVSLGGDFGNDVRVMASGRLTIQPNTTIKGILTYNAPESAFIPSSAAIGSIHYTNTSYLPSSSVTRSLTFISIGIFLLARILGALILAGLLAGLFSKFGEIVTERAATASVRSAFLTILLGFAALVATPVLLVLIALTFIGLGIALLLFICYALLALLAYLYAGILVGGLIARRISGRSVIYWRDGVIGMLAFSILGLIPFLGWLIVILLMTFAAGVLLILFFDFAFPKSGSESEFAMMSVMNMPTVGSKAPDFSLSDQDGKEHSLSDYKGKWVLLYFYPKDDTPGCTIEACTIRDQFKDFKKIGAVVLGVSTDNVPSHKKFATAYELPFTLLADVNKEVVGKYGVFGEKKMYGKTYMGTMRTSFLIDPKGVVAKVYEKVKPEAHATEVISDLKSFGA